MTLIWETYLPITYQQVLIMWMSLTLLFTLLTGGEFSVRLFIYSTVSTMMIWQVPCVAALIMLVMCGIAASRMADVNEPSTPSEPLYPIMEKENAPIKDAVVHKVNGHTIILEAAGRSFVIGKDRDDIAWFQEVGKDGLVKGPKIRGAPNAWRFGSTPNKDLAGFLKRKINTGK
jgi:hypothetical protein